MSQLICRITAQSSTRPKNENWHAVLLEPGQSYDLSTDPPRLLLPGHTVRHANWKLLLVPAIQVDADESFTAPEWLLLVHPCMQDSVLLNCASLQEKGGVARLINRDTITQPGVGRELYYTDDCTGSPENVRSPDEIHC